jgi:hypothetical protein
MSTALLVFETISGELVASGEWRDAYKARIGRFAFPGKAGGDNLCPYGRKMRAMREAQVAALVRLEN